MQQLLYAGEVRSMKDIEIPKTEVKAAELKLAQDADRAAGLRRLRSRAYTPTR